ncbi:MAG: hypothetical protein CMN30_27560 [Sandaracinus sp.]|nr:hypothetical protein [Sandaracinus sp.]|tara:strand:- start:458 stop:739 length:282 start_codon:yes stop_codon:yes gene_type:complete
MSDSREPARRSAVGTTLGWVAGALAFFLLNFFLYQAFGDGYPVEPTSFAAVLVGAFGGMAVADRLGERATKVLGLALGVILAVATVVVFLTVT